MQQDDTAKKKTGTNSSSPTSTEQYLAYLYAYREQIDQISRLIDFTPPRELVSDNENLSNLALQIADVIHNLENLSGNLLEKRFKKVAVLKHLLNARVELNTVTLLATASDQQASLLSFQHLVKCRDSLNMAKSLMPSQTSS